MKKQALLLLALVFSANVSAAPVNFKAYQDALTTALNKNTTAIFSTAFAAAVLYVMYKFYTNGPFDATKPEVNNDQKERETQFMKEGYTNGRLFATTAEEVAPAPTVATPAQEAAPVATQDQSALAKQDAYWEKFTERQMEILS